MICLNSTQCVVPAALLFALGDIDRQLKYTVPKFVYYAVGLWGAELCGAFGDGANGAYEWFIWRGGKLETSNCGYGSPHVALRDVLNRVEPPEVQQR